MNESRGKDPATWDEVLLDIDEVYEDVYKRQVYSVSDPRADIFKKFVKQLATEKGCEKEYALYEMVEHRCV